MNNVKKLIKRLIIVCIIIYAVITFFNQQKILNTYASNDAELDKKLVQAQEYQEELNKIKNNVNSNEYIEEVAREKLDMYLPNERVYLNQ
ncbi:MAG: septum formation initiator family protein [Clostridia bacterium]|nr:septum formation initiator family protein [Clostridia bacterium]